MDFEKRKIGFVRWGHALQAMLEERTSNQGESIDNPLNNIVQSAYRANPWFTPENSVRALQSYADWLSESSLEQWLSAYPSLNDSRNSLRNIGLVLAGNIPAVGFHDVLCVLASGNRASVKLSQDDALLLPFLLEVLMDVDQDFKSLIQIAYKFQDIDAVIATGSNNSARYFDYYFGKYPHIIRKNRNAAAVIHGSESSEELNALGKDIFSYFGLGCRNVSHLFVPEGYDFSSFFEEMEPYGEALMQHNKYMNNYDYHRALFLLNSETFLTNNFLLLREHEQLSTPVSVLHYSAYATAEELQRVLSGNAEALQCVVGGGHLSFGTAQHPSLSDYADSIDTMQFLLDLDQSRS